MNTRINRRQFIRSTALSTGAFYIAANSWRVTGSPNGKINCAFVGIGGRGAANFAEVAKLTDAVNVVALCDIDQLTLDKGKAQFERASTYQDFRKLLEQKDIDAVVISTPDHTHAVAAAGALKTGRHVYCEKPLTRTISEARAVTELARKQKRITQIGTQIHAGANYRRVVELIQSGAIGPVQDVHVWVSATYGGMELPTEQPPVPEHLDYDLWLGPVPWRPYSPQYVPNAWRNWWAFGGGALADFGCHFMDLPFWALNLKYPSAVEVLDGPAVHPESTPPWLILRYEYAARPKAATSPAQPPLSLFWYHGGRQPELLTEQQKKDWKSGVLFIGENGMLLSDYGRHQLLPEEKFKDFVRPAPSIPDSIGHHKEWIEACRGNGSTTCHFDYSGPLTEAALLGNVAYRVQKRLQWDPATLKAKNCPEADEFIQHEYREGWSL